MIHDDWDTPCSILGGLEPKRTGIEKPKKTKLNVLEHILKQLGVNIGEEFRVLMDGRYFPLDTIYMIDEEGMMTSDPVVNLGDSTLKRLISGEWLAVTGETYGELFKRTFKNANLDKLCVKDVFGLDSIDGDSCFLVREKSSNREACIKCWSRRNTIVDDIKQKGIGERIRKHREMEKMTQAELAKRLFVSPSSLCEVEKGKRLPMLSQLIDISEILNVDINLLIYSDEEAFKNSKQNQLNEPQEG